MSGDRTEIRDFDRRTFTGGEMPGGASEAAPHESATERREREAARERARARLAAREADGKQTEKPQPVAPSVAMSLFATLADNVRDYAIFLMDPDGIITYWGEGARLLKWWTREEAEGAHLRLLYPDGGSEDGTAEDHLRKAAERGEYTGEGQRIRSDGSTFWAGISLTALRDAEGTLHGFAKVSRDLTARHAAEAALKAAQHADDVLSAGEAANRTRAEFLTTLSHEIRTPVNAILGYTDLLAAGAERLAEKERLYLERIRASSQHLLGLVNDTLDLSRLEADRMPVAHAAARIGPAIEGALVLVEPQARAKGVRIANELSGAAAETPCFADEERVRQILANVLANAVKFTPAAGRITLSAGTAERPSPDAQLNGPGPWIWIRVEDTGPGIAADRLAAIFEPFVQADDSTARQHGGSGLGMTISRRLARAMQGDLTATSAVGYGSSFLLWLPAVPDAVAPLPVPGEA